MKKILYFYLILGLIGSNLIAAISDQKFSRAKADFEINLGNFNDSLQTFNSDKNKLSEELPENIILSKDTILERVKRYLSYEKSYTNMQEALNKMDTALAELRDIDVNEEEKNELRNVIDQFQKLYNKTSDQFKKPTTTHDQTMDLKTEAENLIRLKAELKTTFSDFLNKLYNNTIGKSTGKRNPIQTNKADYEEKLKSIEQQLKNSFTEQAQKYEPEPTISIIENKLMSELDAKGWTIIGEENVPRLGKVSIWWKEGLNEILEKGGQFYKKDTFDIIRSYNDIISTPASKPGIEPVAPRDITPIEPVDPEPRTPITIDDPREPVIDF
ncbi:hypothetical protein A3F66_02630 [candidate division TM6 bacterium RIFCSPHIGHO2_12_FULL_32_22]|nr:MAG: hypothetical protein A3F66_02630 [candidate division TM6 bacterium RIFCSPHIGHO2_12_FULL_32_22]